jgi:hypothetical protein
MVTPIHGQNMDIISSIPHFHKKRQLVLREDFATVCFSFLRTDLDGLLCFQLNPDLTAQLRDCVNQQIPTNTMESDRPQVFTRFMQGNNSVHDINNNEFFTKLHLIVIKATVLPFSALTTYSIRGFRSTDTSNQHWNYCNSSIF